MLFRVSCLYLAWWSAVSRLDIRRISSRHITNRTTPYSHMIEFSKRDEKTRYLTRAIDEGSWSSDDPLWRVETSRAEGDQCGRGARDDDDEVQISTEKRRGERRRVTQHRYSGWWFATPIFSCPKPCAPARSSLWHTHPPMLSDPWIYG